jgi:hypothetical protein
MINEAIVCIAIIACTTLSRLPFLILSSSDRHTQLWLLKVFSQNRGLKVSRIPHSILQGTICYPPLPAALISRLPQQYWPGAGTLLNIGSDSLVAVGIYIIARGCNLEIVNAHLTALVWATLPILHPVNARLSGIAGRGIGTALVFCCFFGLLRIEQGFQNSGALIAIAAAILVILTSQFALQVLLFASLSMMLFAGNSKLLLLVLAAVTIGLAIPALGLRTQLWTKFLHYQWYYRHGRSFVAHRNSPSHLFRLLKQSFPKAISYVLVSTTPGTVAVGLVGIVPLVVIGQGGIDWMARNSGNQAAFYWMAALSLVPVAAITTKGPLCIFGEAERYIEYSAMFLVVALALSFYQVPSLGLAIAVVTNLMGVFLNLALANMNRLKSALDGEDLQEETKLLEDLSKYGPRAIVTSPISLASRFASVDNSNNTFLNHLVINSRIKFGHWPSGLATYPMPEMNQERLSREFGADTIIVEKSWLPRLTGVMDPKRLTVQTKVESRLYIVYILSPCEKRQIYD